MAVNRTAPPENTVLLLSSEIADGWIVCSPTTGKAKGLSPSRLEARLSVGSSRMASSTRTRTQLLAEEINGSALTMRRAQREKETHARTSQIADVSQFLRFLLLRSSVFHPPCKFPD